MVGKFSKHLGEGQEVEIDGEMFLLKPLTTEYLPDFFKVMKAFGGVKEGDSDIFKNIDDESLMSLKKIINVTLEKSFPNEDPEERAQFGMKYMMELMTAIFELNTSQKNIEIDKKKKILEKINANKIKAQGTIVPKEV